LESGVFLLEEAPEMGCHERRGLQRELVSRSFGAEVSAVPARTMAGISIFRSDSTRSNAAQAARSASTVSGGATLLKSTLLSRASERSMRRSSSLMGSRGAVATRHRASMRREEAGRSDSAIASSCATIPPIEWATTTSRRRSRASMKLLTHSAISAMVESGGPSLPP